VIEDNGNFKKYDASVNLFCYMIRLALCFFLFNFILMNDVCAQSKYWFMLEWVEMYKMIK
jgi:hypothetical protein